MTKRELASEIKEITDGWSHQLTKHQQMWFLRSRGRREQNSDMITYEFKNINEAHAFHAEALQYGTARWGGQIAGWYPETFTVEVSPEFDAIVEARRAKVAE